MTSSRGYLEGMVSNVLWGTTFLATHQVLAAWGPITSSALRFAIAACVLFVTLKITKYPIQRPPSRSAWAWLLLTAILGFGMLYPLQSKGLTIIPTGLSAIIMLTAPFFLVALTVLLGQTVPPRKWVAILIGTAGGITLIASRQTFIPQGTESALTGIGMTFAAALCLAVSSLTTKKVLVHMNQGSVTLWSIAIGALLLAPFAVVETQPIGHATPNSWFYMLYLAIICSVIAFFLWNRALAIGDSASIASTMHIKTPIAVFLGCFLNSEALSLQLIIGGLLVGFGVWLAQRKPPETPRVDRRLEAAA